MGKIYYTKLNLLIQKYIQELENNCGLRRSGYWYEVEEKFPWHILLPFSTMKLFLWLCDQIIY